MSLRSGNTKKKFVIDVDGTICSQEPNYVDAKPYVDRINFINGLYDKGHTIVYFTARGSETGIDWRFVTERQFIQWGVKYDELVFGKPSADYYIDDRMFDISLIDKSITETKEYEELCSLEKSE